MRLLVAYDGSEHSAFALDEAARLAAEGGTEVVVLSVVPPSARGSKAGGHVGLAPHADADVGQARAYFDKRGIDTTLKIAHGDPAHEITKEAREGGYDRIVVGTRELGPIARHLLGSVSRKVADDAPCKVTVAGASGVAELDPATTDTA
jgi:nucleotide-binding universal stress UspA family protein